MGIEVVVEGLTKSFGRRTVWRDVTLSLPQGEVSVMLGPSGTGKTVFLKALIGLIKPERGRVLVDGVDTAHCSEHDLHQVRKRFGVLFQDGALFGSMNLFDNIAFPLREHTKKTESEIRTIVYEKMAMVGLGGEERKLPGEISGGMRKRAGLARALVMDPQIILCDEPDSGLDPVRTALLSQLLIDLNAQIDATILIVTHNIQVARTVPDNMGMLFRGDLVMFGPREVLLTSDEPAVAQFLNGSKFGPIGMSEEKDQATIAMEQAHIEAGLPDGSTGEDMGVVVPQIEPSPGMPVRQAVQRRLDRVMSLLHTLPPAAQQAILASMSSQEQGPRRMQPPDQGAPTRPLDPVNPVYKQTQSMRPAGGPPPGQPAPGYQPTGQPRAGQPGAGQPGYGPTGPGQPQAAPTAPTAPAASPRPPAPGAPPWPQAEPPDSARGGA